MRTNTGTQPGWQVLRDQARTIAGVARLIPVTPAHLKNALSGLTTPRPEVVERLPQILDVPLEQLFTEEALSRPFGKGRPWGNGASR